MTILAMQRALSWHDSERKFGRITRLNRRLLGMVAGGLAGAVLASLPAPAATVTDGANRSVTISAGVTSVVPAGPPAQVLLHALAPGLLAGLVEPFKPEHAIYVDPKIVALPQIPLLSRTDAPGDIAAVAELKPGLCVDFGSVSARYVASTEKIAKELSIPAVIFAGSLAGTASVVTTLGGALGQDARAKEVAAAVSGVLAEVAPVSQLPDEGRVGVYLARGADGLQGMRAGTSFDEPIRLAGGHNVVAAGGGTFARLSVADVVALKPAVVVVGDIDALTSPLHDALPKETVFVLDDGQPYKVLAGPPSINRIVGLLALAAILHPDKVKADPEAISRLETMLFPIPAGLAEPAPLQIKK